MSKSLFNRMRPGVKTRSWCLLALLALLTACSEEDNSVEEFPDWQSANETYYSQLYASALQQATAGDASWKVLRNWSLTDGVPADASNSIVVHVLASGDTEAATPLYTDTVRVVYRGRLLPSTSYAEGYVFDSSYTGDYNLQTAMPSKFAVNDVVNGFSTALQHMHKGDRWEVYIPYQLGYGEDDQKDASTKKVRIPAYSTLVFDLTLVDSYHRNETVPSFK